MSITATGSVPRIALVGDRSPGVRSHARIPVLVEALRSHDNLVVDPYWLATEDVEPGAVRGFDGVWVLPGSPYRSEAGAVAAIRDAREAGIPFLGTCGGFQHALLEFARDVCGMEGIAHAENDPDAEECLIVELACSLAGHEAPVTIEPGTLAASILAMDRTVERYVCSYGPSPEYLRALAEHGLRFTGHDGAGDVRIAELPGHPFFLGTLFQPELGGDGSRAHPIVRAFATAAAAHAAAREDVPAVAGAA